MLSYFASCQVETEASHPGLATDTEECYFLGSWGVWDFQGLASGGSYQAWGAVKSSKGATIKTSADLVSHT